MKTQNTHVTISTATLNCLKQLLFSDKGGTDLTNIVNDLGGDDLTAINVGLIHKGIKPEIDTQSRYATSYKGFRRYDFVSYSMILDKVYVKTSNYEWTENGDAKLDCSGDNYLSLQAWLTMDTQQPTKDTED